MRQQFIDFSLQWLRILIVAIAVFFIVCLAAASIIVFSRAIAVILPGSTPQNGQLTSNSPLTVVQAQEKFDEGQNDINVATNVITFSGVFIALSSIILALVGVFAAVAAFLRVRESRDIRNLKFKFENDINEINNRANQVEKKFDEGFQTFQNLLNKSAEQAKDIEDENRILEGRLRQLDQRIDFESQKFIEASYYYSEGTKDYRAGDNKHAIENYLQALKYLPKSSRILERIGRTYSNLNEEEKAIEYLKLALDLDPDDEPALRSLALYYRYSNNQEAIKLLKRMLANNLSAYESWDFLGLCYRDQLQQGHQLIKDQEIIDKAIDAHENALKIQKRPETEFYLGILLFFSPTGDKNRARVLLLSASKRVEEQEHDVRIRGVWKMLILAGAPIVEGKQEEALKYIQDMVKYNPSQRIHMGVESHLRFLLEGTGHSDWIEEFMGTINAWKEA
jgi:tetratricopeptide (TPR) repeat protein